MKTAHIVYCHPEPGSFVSAMATTARDTLQDQGWEVSFSDLYAKNFNPVAHAKDFASRRNPAHLVYSLEQRHALETDSLAPDIAEELQPVMRADLLILVFPVFWFSMPAMLKGWIDRVFMSGRFYGGRRVYDQGGMVGRKAMVITSLGGREHMFGAGAVHGELGMGMLRHLLQGSLGYVGYEVFEPFIAYHVPYVTEEARRGMLASLRSELEALDERPTVGLPTLRDFDEQFRPLHGAAAAGELP